MAFLSLWVLYYGTGVLCEDGYQFSARSHLCLAMSAVGTDLDTPDWPAFRRQVSDSRMVGDYAPTTATITLRAPTAEAEDVWMAWEFVRPEERGRHLRFRRFGGKTALKPTSA